MTSVRVARSLDTSWYRCAPRASCTQHQPSYTSFRTAQAPGSFHRRPASFYDSSSSTWNTASRDGAEYARCIEKARAGQSRPKETRERHAEPPNPTPRTFHLSPLFSQRARFATSTWRLIRADDRACPTRRFHRFLPSFQVLQIRERGAEEIRCTRSESSICNSTRAGTLIQAQTQSRLSFSPVPPIRHTYANMICISTRAIN